MRHYLIRAIALSVEKKGVDVVRRVSVLQSVTVDVTIAVEVTELNNRHRCCKRAGPFVTQGSVCFRQENCA